MTGIILAEETKIISNAVYYRNVTKTLLYIFQVSVQLQKVLYDYNSAFSQHLVSFSPKKHDGGC